MEGNINKVKTNHPDFDKNFFSDVIEATLMCPKQRIANLASGFANPKARGKIRELLLCDRFCCKVRALYCYDKFMSNKNLISECLTDPHFWDLQNTRKNTVKLLHSMFYDENENIRNMARDILKDALSSSESSNIYQDDEFDTEIDEMVNELSTKEKSSISENKANELLRNKDSMSDFLKNIENNFEGGDRRSIDETVSIIEGLFSEKNIKNFLRKKDNVGNVLLQLFENKLVEQGISKDLKIKAVDFIERLLSEKYIVGIMKVQYFTGFILKKLKESLESKLQVGKIADIIKNLFSKKNVNGIFTNKDFLQKILNLMESLFINVSDDNKDLKEKVMAIVKELFSEENINSMFKKDFDVRVAGSEWVHINLIDTLVNVLPEMLKNKCLRKGANEITRELFSGKKIDTISRDNYFPLKFVDKLFEILKDKQLDKDSKDAAHGILKDLFSSENIGILFENGEPGEAAYAFEHTFQRILKSSIKGVSCDKELKKEVLSLLDALMRNKNINDSFKKNIKEKFKSVLPQGDKPAIEKSNANGTANSHILGKEHRKSDKKNIKSYKENIKSYKKNIKSYKENIKSDKNIENTVKEEWENKSIEPGAGGKLIRPVIIW